jgi:hypothetical protein
MQSGIDFLRAQVAEAAVVHAALLESLVYHEGEATDARYRDLCDRHLPRMREHQLMLEDLRASLGAKSEVHAIHVARSFADAKVSDYKRLSEDLDLARRLEVTFKTFRDAGRQLRIDQLALVGETAERHHDEYSSDAKRLLLQMFVERAHDASDGIRAVANDHPVDTRIR